MRYGVPGSSNPRFFLVDRFSFFFQEPQAMTRQANFPKLTSFTLVIFAIVAIVSHSGTAMAGTKAVGGTHSESEIKGACDRAGGVFFSTSEGYSCEAAGGSVECGKSGKCVGTCDSCAPDVVKGDDGSVVGVLSGTKMKEQGNASPKATGEPAKTAEPIKANEPTRTAGPAKPAESAKTESAGIKKPVDESKKGELVDDHHTKK
jgi:hypothetical protein